jgi:hypothetical protein
MMAGVAAGALLFGLTGFGGDSPESSAEAGLKTRVAQAEEKEEPGFREAQESTVTLLHGSPGWTASGRLVWGRALDRRGAPAMPFKANRDRRHHIPKQRHQVTNWATYDASLRARGSLTVWFTAEAMEAWKAEPRTGRGGQPRYSDLAIATALTLRTVFRLALRQTEGLIGSVLQLLGLDLPVPDHSTLSRRAETLEVPRPKAGSEPVHLLVDSTGLKFCGPGEWLVEKHGTKRRRSWKKLHLATDADTGQIIASVLTDKDADDGSQVGPLLERIDGAVASFTGDGAYDRDDVYAEVAARHPAAAVVVPPRANAVPSNMAETAPTQRDRHLRCIAERGRMGWQRARDTAGVLWWRPISRAGNALLAAGCARRRRGDKRPR